MFQLCQLVDEVVLLPAELGLYSFDKEIMKKLKDRYDNKVRMFSIILLDH